MSGAIQTSLREVVDDYVSAQPTSKSYSEYLRRCTAQYERWLCASPEQLDPFCRSSVKAWLAEIAQRLAPSTVNLYRQTISCIVRFHASREGGDFWIAPIGGYTKPIKPQPSLLSVRDAALYLGIAQEALRSRTRAGLVKSVKVRSRRLYSKLDLDYHLATHDQLIRRKRRRRESRLTDYLDRTVEEYINARPVCDKQAERLRLHVRCFEKWLSDHEDEIRDDSDSVRLSKWLLELSQTAAAETTNGYRQSMVTLLRFATPDGAPLPRTDRIRRQREPDKHRPAFTIDELRRLIDAAPQYHPITIRKFGRGMHSDAIPRTRLDGVPWSTWWEAFVRVGYDSGQYLSDLRLVPWSHVASNGSVSFVRHKTGKMMSFQLTHEATRAASRIGHPDLLLPWDYDVATYFCREFKKFVRSVDGVRALGPKSIRRSAITYTYISQGEEAARILAGHSSFKITAKHYIDWTIAKRAIIRPPTL